MDEKRFQGKMSEDYDLIMNLTYPYYEESRELGKLFIKSQIKDKKEIKILEIGCGTGNFTKFLIKLGGNVSITAIDNENIMIEQAKENLNVADNKLDFVNKDVLEYLKNCLDETYDIIASAYTLHNFNQEYRNLVIKEIYGVLKKDGLFLNIDKYALDDEVKDKVLFDKQLKEFDKFDSIGRSDLKEALIEHEFQDISSEFIMKESKSIDEMNKIGFSEVKVLWRERREAIISALK